MRNRSKGSMELAVLSVFFGGLFFSVGALRLCFGLCRAWYRAHEGRRIGEDVDANLVLGGEASRESFTVSLLKSRPRLTFVSSGSFSLNDALFDGVRDMVVVDNRAVDTLTNYSTLVDEFKRRKIRYVQVITSQYHLRRARLVGQIVLGSRGISSSYLASDMYTTQSLVSTESTLKCTRDVLRALVWVAYEVDGRFLSSMLQMLKSVDFASR
mmetsp:Transcript_23397/g.92950  ORF Transcript_23397/g.92950 Transcript_23397/m.92950 type:complete len:212 (-) Transcript_23397:2832-3467(-)